MDSLRHELPDITASTNSRQAENGSYCGLIKVQTNINGLNFYGDIAGDISNDMNEYRIYIEKGATTLTIVRPEYLPLTIHLSDYGIDAIGAKQTYLMKLKDKSIDSDKKLLTIHTTPHDADVTVDGVHLPKDTGGGYKIRLPKGEHICSFKANGYLSDVKMVTMGKESKNLDVTLVSLLQDVTVISQTTDADIFINNESKGIGSWRGKLMPGLYEIEARRDGCVSYKQSSSIEEIGHQTISIPKLAPISCNITISTTPKRLPVYLDGIWAGNSPCIVEGLKYGTHFISSSIDTLGLSREKETSIIVRDKDAQEVHIELMSESKYQLHKDAKEWMKEAMVTHTNVSGWMSTDALDYYDRIYKHLDEFEPSFFRLYDSGEWHSGLWHRSTYAFMIACFYYKLIISYPIPDEWMNWDFL